METRHNKKWLFEATTFDDKIARFEARIWRDNVRSFVRSFFLNRVSFLIFIPFSLVASSLPSLAFFFLFSIKIS